MIQYSNVEGKTNIQKNDDQYSCSEHLHQITSA